MPEFSKLIITIDGPVASGKSTVAGMLALRLNLFHLSVGGLHRANAWALNDYRVDLANENAITDNMREINVSVEKNDKGYRYFVNQNDVTDKIFSPEIGELASQLGLLPVVEEHIHTLAHRIADEKREVILDGRGLNSIFPKANIKIYLTADLDQRVARYRNLLLERGIVPDFNSTRDQIVIRDSRDQTRLRHPLVVSKDATVVDTTKMSIYEVVLQLEKLVKDYQCTY